jgi:hypothetical protein
MNGQKWQIFDAGPERLLLSPSFFAGLLEAEGW